jgi:carbon-monoxide dehydrogenase medium subunit
MKMPRFTYHRPETVDEALAILSEHDDAKVLAGGQSLIPLMALRLGQPAHLVDIGRLDELKHITDDGAGVVVGAGATHLEAERSGLVASAAPMVARAEPLIGHRAIRSRGTVCGSLAHADPAAELPAVALASGASFVARSTQGERVIAAADFFDGYLSTALAPDELLVAVRFPAVSPTAGVSVLELSRRHGDFALIGVAAMIDVDTDGIVSACSLSYFGADAVPCRVADAEASVIGGPPEATTFADAAAIVSKQLDPPGDIHGSQAYRKHVAGVLTRRALAAAAADRTVAA